MVMRRFPSLRPALLTFLPFLLLVAGLCWWGIMCNWPGGGKDLPDQWVQRAHWWGHVLDVIGFPARWLVSEELSWLVGIPIWALGLSYVFAWFWHVVVTKGVVRQVPQFD